MISSDRLDESLALRDDGHASDLALGLLVDGQDELLSSALLTHVDACPSCGDRLALLAARSLELGEGIATLSAARSAVPAPVRFPHAALALASSLAAVGLALGPTLAHGGWLGTLGSGLRELLVFWRGARIAFPSLVASSSVAWVGVALVLGSLGIWIARSARPVLEEAR
ncbi:MAG TPA: hypothetical protein VLC09_03800 [Polyangiaceae bacterium]|nr:hypothetical protein [Polyangiaceae bacterium]